MVAVAVAIHAGGADVLCQRQERSSIPIHVDTRGRKDFRQRRRYRASNTSGSADHATASTIRSSWPVTSHSRRRSPNRSGKEADRLIIRTMVKLPVAPPAPATPIAPRPATRRLLPRARFHRRYPAARAASRVEGAACPWAFAFCPAAIGRSWTGYPFDGVTSIRLPAQRYPIRG